MKKKTKDVKHGKIKDDPDVCCKCGQRIRSGTGLISMMANSYCGKCIEEMEE